MSAAQRIGITRDQLRELLPYKLEEPNDDGAPMKGDEILVEFETRNDLSKALRQLRSASGSQVEDAADGTAYSRGVPADFLARHAAEIARLRESLRVQSVEDPNAEEVMLNYVAFKSEVDDYMKDHKGQYVLMHDRKVVEFFDTHRDAYTAGALLFKDLYDGGRYSVQEVTNEPIYVGGHHIMAVHD